MIARAASCSLIYSRSLRVYNSGS